MSVELDGVINCNAACNPLRFNCASSAAIMALAAELDQRDQSLPMSSRLESQLRSAYACRIVRDYADLNAELEHPISA